MAKALAAFGLILICAITSNAVSPSKFFVVIFGLFFYDFAPIYLTVIAREAIHCLYRRLQNCLCTLK